MIYFQIHGLHCPICLQTIAQADIHTVKVENENTIVDFECWQCKVPMTLAMQNDTL